MAPKELFISWVSEWLIYVLNLTHFSSILSYIYIGKYPMVRVCGSNTDPDPQHWYRYQEKSREKCKILQFSLQRNIIRPFSPGVLGNPGQPLKGRWIEINRYKL